MKDLPPGVKEMNDNMRMPPAGSQVRLGWAGRLRGRGAWGRVSGVGGALLCICRAEIKRRRSSLAQFLNVCLPTSTCGLQSEAEIRGVVQEAQKSNTAAPPGWEVRFVPQGTLSGRRIMLPCCPGLLFCKTCLSALPNCRSPTPTLPPFHLLLL